jgi:FAD dependent monooxygenase
MYISTQYLPRIQSSSPSSNPNPLTMALPSPPNFKAIIVGGSVAGLTLAHTFQRANIPYILLEARDTISPQLGASIVIMPNGARILDQMGLYEGLKREVMGPMKKAYVWREDGRGVSCNEWPRLVEER